MAEILQSSPGILIYLSVIVGLLSVVYSGYLVWLRNKAQRDFRDKLEIAFTNYYTDDELKGILAKIRKNEQIDVYNLQKLKELYINTIKDLDIKERALIAHALYQPSEKGRNDYIVKTTNEIVVHSH